MMRIIRYGFSVNWSKSAKEVLGSVCNEIKTNRNFIKQNAIYVVHHLADLIDRGQWNNALTFMRAVKTQNINKWEIWEQMAKAICLNLQKQNHMSFDQMKTALKFLYKVRYQPSIKEDSIFLNKLSQQLQNLIKKQDIFSLSSLTLMNTPEIFTKYKQQMEQSIQNKIKQVQSPNSLPEAYRFTILQGIFANFWTSHFINSLKQQINPNSPFFKYIQLQDLSVPIRIEKESLQNTNSSVTQKKIGEMMRDLCYVFEQNMFINGLQVDFLFAKCIILEFDGMKHYKINQGRKYPVPTKFQLWRTYMLRHRGFNILRIPFYEWEKLQNEKVQKMYLINKIQKGVLEAMRKKQKAAQK